MKDNYEIQGQITLEEILNADSLFGKTSLMLSAPETPKEQTSKRSCKKSVKSSARTVPLFLSLKKGGTTQEALMEWEMTERPLVFHGEHMTLNTGEKPSEIAIQEMLLRWGHRSVAEESRLSQILEDCPHPRYNLSAKASAGILRRAKERGKELPELLKTTLEKQAKELCPSKNEQAKMGGKGILIQEERTGTLSTLNNQSVLAQK